jgi:hypothetical protein
MRWDECRASGGARVGVEPSAVRGDAKAVANCVVNDVRRELKAPSWAS